MSLVSKIDKIIKDLKERNDKLLEQYRYRDIRCITLEQRLERLQEELNQKNKVIEEISKELNDYIKEYEPEKWEDMCRNKEILEELEKGSEE